jgi:hypothetical protein
VPKRVIPGVITAIAGIAVVVFILARMKANTGQPDVSEKCVQILAAAAKSSGQTAVTSGDRIEIGSTKVRLQATIEREVKVDKPSGVLIGLTVYVFVNDVLQPLTYGVVGAKADRDDAVQTAVRDWAMYVVEPLLGALGVKIGEEPQKIGSFLVYRGVTGIREGIGSHVSWSKEQDRQLLERLDPFVRGMEHSSGELHSISLMVVVQDGTTKGECRVDGHTSPELLQAIQSLSFWNQIGSVYVFKQFYVLRRT